MKELLQRWLADHTLFPGVLACGARLPNRDCVVQSHSDQITADQLREIWLALGEVPQQLGALRGETHHLHWAFEHANIHLALRADGVMLGVITPPGHDRPPALAEVVQGFMQLELPVGAMPAAGA
jgi:glycine cleavage system pyridoxal-binding protein P